jgi:hypothetical protein
MFTKSYLQEILINLSILERSIKLMDEAHGLDNSSKKTTIPLTYLINTCMFNISNILYILIYYFGFLFLSIFT